MIIELLMAWIALIVTLLAHEVGHLPSSIKLEKLSILPSLSARQANWRYGGLVVNISLAYLVFKHKPENMFFLLVGFFSWVHFTLYAILGSFNYEPKISKALWDVWVFDDVPNKYWYIFIPLGVIAFMLFKDFYIPIAMQFIGGII